MKKMMSMVIYLVLGVMWTAFVFLKLVKDVNKTNVVLTSIVNIAIWPYCMYKKIKGKDPFFTNEIKTPDGKRTDSETKPPNN